MGFLGVYKAIYDYAPQSEGELAISEGDLLFVLDKSEDDDWWKAKKKAGGEEDDEPEGLIPNNYVEEAEPSGQARALYEYTRQTDEELSFSEDAMLSVYDTSDPDWILVGLDGEFGFVPSNYIDLDGEGAAPAEEESEEEQQEEERAEEPALPPRAPTLPTRPPVPAEDTPSPPLPPRMPSPGPSSPTAPNPAAALAGILAGRAAPRPATPPPAARPPRPQYTSDPSDEEDATSPPLPTRRAQPAEPPSLPSPQLPRRSAPAEDYDDPPVSHLSPGGFHMYNINEMVSIMGKRKKMPTTLGINLKAGNILIAPERAQDGPSQEWSAERMTHYSQEGKHVFIELVRPSKSVDFHAGAKDTAQEIVSALGELAGAVRAEGLREVIMAGSGHEQKKGIILYEFLSQGDDEVTVAIGDEVIVLDDTSSDEWWQVRRLRNGKEGVVPGSYVEITGTVAGPTPTPSSTSGTNPGRSTVAQNRLEEERLTKEAVRAAMKDESRRQSERKKRENGRAEGSSSRSSGKSKPDASKVRTWTDRSKSFSVEAQFLGVKDGKLNLHKMNGVKIAVPIAKMSVEDLEYVERLAGISLDDDKPLSAMRKKSSHREEHSSSTRVGASVEPKKSDYDWFQFFLDCEVNPGLCERYAQAFIKDSMDESVVPDIDASVLRTLGLREGDILKVMKFLDNKFGRKKKAAGAEDEGEGGLFSGPGGTLRNNTRRGRPAPNSQASDVVDANAFSQDGTNKSSPAAAVMSAVNARSGGATSGGFDDNAWEVKPSKQSEKPAEAPAPAAVAKQVPALTGSMQELSMLSQPLQPDKTATPAAPVITPATAPPAQPAQATGATPSFFTAMAQQATGVQGVNGARQRPLAPQYTSAQGGLIAPPPSRPLSAPQSAQPSGFAPPPLYPQMTGAVVGQVAPPGQSLNDITQARMQQQYVQQMQQQAALMQQQQQQAMMAQPTGMMNPMMTGMPGQFGMMNGPQQMQSPFADPVGRGNQFSPVQAQPTGWGGGGGGVNSFLPQPLVPERTGMPPPPPAPRLQQQQQPMPMQAQPTGFTQGFGNHGMPTGAAGPPQPQGPGQPQPLVPQQTGPAPPVRFGVEPGQARLMPQATGRRANLSAATPQNPFGF